MNNEPVAWMDKESGVVCKEVYATEMPNNLIPLYTHPVKEQKCVVKGCENHKHEGGFNGDVCSPCYQFIVHGKGVNSQAYRNTHLAELTDEEIQELALSEEFWMSEDCTIFDWFNFARAILRKAQEK